MFLLLATSILFNYSCKTSDPEDLNSLNTIKDVDGNVYNTIVIGTQTWMVENLKTTKFNTKEPITQNTSWNDLKVGQYCNYMNDQNYGLKYGRLYDYYAVHSGKLAPKGWHIPSKEEWLILKNYVSSNLAASGNAAKALASTSDWLTSSKSGCVGFNMNLNNSSGFTAQPAGELAVDEFADMHEACYLWSSSFEIEEDIYFIPLFFKIEYSSKDVYIEGIESGHFNSVRCIKDSK